MEPIPNPGETTSGSSTTRRPERVLIDPQPTKIRRDALSFVVPPMRIESLRHESDDNASVFAVWGLSALLQGREWRPWCGWKEEMEQHGQTEENSAAVVVEVAKIFARESSRNVLHRSHDWIF